MFMQMSTHSCTLEAFSGLLGKFHPNRSLSPISSPQGIASAEFDNHLFCYICVLLHPAVAFFTTRYTLNQSARHRDTMLKTEQNLLVWPRICCTRELPWRTCSGHVHITHTISAIGSPVQCSSILRRIFQMACSNCAVYSFVEPGHCVAVGGVQTDFHTFLPARSVS